MEGLHDKRKGMETSSQGDEEYQHFLEDLEEDPELRQHVNIFKDKRKMDQLVIKLYRFAPNYYSFLFYKRNKTLKVADLSQVLASNVKIPS
jgi:hypothetical protein